MRKVAENTESWQVYIDIYIFAHRIIATQYVMLCWNQVENARQQLIPLKLSNNI